MPQATVPIGAAWTLVTQVSGTPSPATGAISWQSTSAKSVRIGRGTSTVPPTVFFVVGPLEGGINRTLAEMFPGGSGDHLWAQQIEPNAVIQASWA